MVSIDKYFELVKQTPSKKWNPQEDNYYVVFNTIHNQYATFTVNDFFVDPLRRYYTKEAAYGLVRELNRQLKEQQCK